MPASIFTEMEQHTGSNVLEDQRALQLAMELSLFTLGNESESGYSSGGYESESRSKKSQNTTECVPVPSSEHVAEIVGRQGCKIKALRAKTNTYIKTPVRGEEPVFVVTGRKEDVSAAKREILSAAEHFSQIRAQRKNNMNGSLAPGPNSSIPGQTTIQVRVPYRVVGLVVGPKGATIKRIQQQTNTYIVTPSREKEPVFEVTGLPENVETARKEIEAHIAMRTGGLPDSSTSSGSSGNNSTTEDDDFHVNGIDRVFTAATVATTNYVNSIYKSEFGHASPSISRESNNILTSRSQDIFTFPTHTIPTDGGSPKITDIYSCPPGFTGFSNGFGLYDVDEGLGDSPTFEQAVFPSTSSVWSDFGPVRSTVSPLFGTTTTSTTPSGTAPRRSNSLGSADSGISDPLLLDHPPARRIHSDPLVDTLANFPPITAVSTVSTIADCFTVTSCSGTSTNSASTPTESVSPLRKRPKRDCAVCFESEVVAALVPCGHNMFCMECANRICEKTEPECPICRQQALQAIRIYS